MTYVQVIRPFAFTFKTGIEKEHKRDSSYHVGSDLQTLLVLSENSNWPKKQTVCESKRQQSVLVLSEQKQKLTGRETGDF